MEADKENWKEAQLCFDSVLKFDQRSWRQSICSSRPLGIPPTTPASCYALYVAELGDVDAARSAGTARDGSSQATRSSVAGIGSVGDEARYRRGG